MLQKPFTGFLHNWYSWKCQESYFFLSWSMGAAHKSSWPKVFFKRGVLNILQNSQENSPWLQLYQKADCNIYSFYHYYLKHQIIEFFFWSFFCLFIDHLVIFCPTFQVITIMQILLCSFYFSLSLNKLPQLVFFF